jgi:hypothetical protein
VRDVELDAVGAVIDRAEEGRQGVFRQPAEAPGGHKSCTRLLLPRRPGVRSGPIIAVSARSSAVRFDRDDRQWR